MYWSWQCKELATTVTRPQPINYHVWGYMKALVYAHKVYMREELLQRILSAARNFNNAAVLHKFTSPLAKQVRKCIQAV